MQFKNFNRRTKRSEPANVCCFENSDYMYGYSLTPKILRSSPSLEIPSTPTGRKGRASGTRIEMRDPDVACVVGGISVRVKAGECCRLARVWEGIFGIQDLTKIWCRIREEAKHLDGKRDLTAFREAGFTKIWARDARGICLPVCREFGKSFVLAGNAKKKS